MRTRRTRTILVVLAILLLAIPVSAGVSIRANVPDQSVRNDLWQTYGTHRLGMLDNNVNAGNDIIATLQKYGYDTTALSADVSAVEQSRAPLSAAIAAHDAATIMQIDQQNAATWTQFVQTVRSLLKDQAAGLPGAPSS